ncbi:hypothetical protein [Arenimonas sp. MALMAid1274]|uniref:hypothetical protein n=1 Tax=Arenimonas sp. MALMAid1274 TaxID=3411630 RepID=UPI003BA0E61E
MALATLVATTTGGCVLDRSAILPGWSVVEPRQYCPGDSIAVSYDFLRGETCRSATACATHQPTVTITSLPADFPTRTTAGYADSFSFVPSGDRVQLDFTPDRNAVRVPTNRTDAEGRAIDLLRENVNPERAVLTRITGTIETTLVHEGLCAGSSPTHAPARLPGPPTLSANLDLVELCNLNGVPVIVTLSETDSGVVTERMLGPRECFSPSEPGAPGGGETANVVSIRSLIPDVGARCSATGPNTPPAPLRTLARSACG